MSFSLYFFIVYDRNRYFGGGSKFRGFVGSFFFSFEFGYVRYRSFDLRCYVWGCEAVCRLLVSFVEERRVVIVGYWVFLWISVNMERFEGILVWSRLFSVGLFFVVVF